MTDTGTRRRGPRLVGISSVALALTLVACTTTSPSAAAPTSDPPRASAGASAPPSAAPSSATASPGVADVTRVVIRDSSFGPPEISVAVGIVTFVNEDDVAHTVTEGENGAAAADARFDELVNVGRSVEITFPEAGDYRLTCQFHAEMQLLVHAH